MTESVDARKEMAIVAGRGSSGEFSARQGSDEAGEGGLAESKPMQQDGQDKPRVDRAVRPHIVHLKFERADQQRNPWPRRHGSHAERQFLNPMPTLRAHPRAPRLKGFERVQQRLATRPVRQCDARAPRKYVYFVNLDTRELEAGREPRPSCAQLPCCFHRTGGNLSVEASNRHARALDQIGGRGAVIVLDKRGRSIDHRRNHILKCDGRSILGMLYIMIMGDYRDPSNIGLIAVSE